MIIQSKKVWIADQFISAAVELEQGKITGTAYTNAYDQGATAAKYALDLLSGAKKKADKTEMITVPPFAATKDSVAQIKPEQRW